MSKRIGSGWQHGYEPYVTTAEADDQEHYWTPKPHRSRKRVAGAPPHKVRSRNLGRTAGEYLRFLGGSLVARPTGPQAI
jgi:hypothetical protein